MQPTANVQATCLYTKLKEDGWAAYWTTQCGYPICIESPMEVGFSFAPLPNEDGKFCCHCGRLIELKEES